MLRKLCVLLLDDDRGIGLTAYNALLDMLPPEDAKLLNDNVIRIESRVVLKFGHDLGDWLPLP